MPNAIWGRGMRQVQLQLRRLTGPQLVGLPLQSGFAALWASGFLVPPPASAVFCSTEAHREHCPFYLISVLVLNVRPLSSEVALSLGLFYG